MNYLKFTHDKLSIEAITELASSPTCGAISVFVGTTRDNFDGKEVINLEYEAYESMGLKILENICQEIRNQWNEVENIAIYHRLGTVPVKEASIVIAISSPHRTDAIKATDWCIDNVKKRVTIWKKELYADDKTEWKENKEWISNPMKMRKIKLNYQPSVHIPTVPPYLVQVKASNDDINKRIENLMDRKRSEINYININEFSSGDRNSEFSCARIDTVFQKRNDSKGHLQVSRVLNTYHRDQTNSDYLSKHIPPNGIEERVKNLEIQLSLVNPLPRGIYVRLKNLENRMLHLESISPEYVKLWDKCNLRNSNKKRKKLFSMDEIDSLIDEAKTKVSVERRDLERKR